MSLLVRQDGRILCAAMYNYEPDDITYIDDGVHYYLSVITKQLVTQRFEEHVIRGEWWWKDQVPDGIEIDDFYNEKNNVPPASDN